MNYFNKRSNGNRAVIAVTLAALAALFSQFTQALVVDPALFYSAQFNKDVEVEAEDPSELADAYDRYNRQRFDACMGQAPPFSCVLLEINRKFESSFFTNGLPNAITWYMRQTNLYVNPDGSSITTVNENGLNYLQAEIAAVCPDENPPFALANQSGADGKVFHTFVCPFQEELPDRCALAGNPVNFLTGEKIEVVRDFSGRAGLDLRRKYINQKIGWRIEPVDFLSDLSRPLAAGDGSVGECLGYPYSRSLNRWDFSSPGSTRPIASELSFCLDFVGSEQAAGISQAADVVITTDDGRVFEFRSQSGRYVSETPGLLLQVVPDGSAGGSAWMFTDEDASIRTFDSNGYLIRSQPSGSDDIVFYGYQGGKVHTKSNRFGDQLTFNYNEENQVQTVSLPDGADILYDFEPMGPKPDSFRLKGVKYADGRPVAYLYEDARYPAAMTGFIDGSGKVFAKWSYDERGRAVTSEHGARKERFTFDFSEYEDQKVSVTNPLGKQTSYFFELINGQKKITRADGHVSANCAAASRYRSYYSNGSLQTVTDWQGNVTHYERDGLGRVVRETRGLRWSGDPQYGVISSVSFGGVPGSYVKETCWHATANRPARVIEPGRVTVLDYDSEGRLTSRRVEARTGVNASCL